MKPIFCALAGAAAMLATAAAGSPSAGAAEKQRADEAAGRRAPQRIIFGQTEQAESDFRTLRPLRRSAASTRQAYFGSGALYSETLDRLQARMRSITARAQFEDLELSPAQEAVKGDLAPALVRALALSQRARRDGAD